jgi:hypothetical protein
MNEVVWAPQAGPQTAAVQSPVPELFYGGARGGGKTDFLLGDWAIHAGQYGQHARGIIFRRTLTEFAEIKRRSQEIYRPLGWVYLKQEKEWHSTNGAILKLAYLYDESDAGTYQGWAHSYVGVDEAGNYPNPDAIDLMRATLRSAHGVPTFMRLTGNPGGIGHLWLKERYIDPAPPYHPHEYEPQPELAPGTTVQAVFIPARLEDNQILVTNDPDYEKRLAAVGGPALYRAWRMGDWDAIVGAAFPEWRREHHVYAPSRYDPDWYRHGGGDWGYTSPGHLLAAALGPQGEIYIYWEHRFQGQAPYDVGVSAGTSLARGFEAGQIPGYPHYIALDRSAWDTGDGRGGRFRSVAELMQEGLRSILGDRAPILVQAPKGKGSRHTGKAIIHQMLSYDVDRDGNVPPWLAPKLRISPQCREIIKTLPALVLDERDPEDIDTEQDDHAYDALRYLLASRSPKYLQHAERASPPDRHPGFDDGIRRGTPDWEREFRNQQEPMIEVASRFTRIRRK